jgi:hypothetical protein
MVLKQKFLSYTKAEYNIDEEKLMRGMSDSAPLYAIIIAVAVTLGGIVGLKVIWGLAGMILGY